MIVVGYQAMLTLVWRSDTRRSISASVKNAEQTSAPVSTRLSVKSSSGKAAAHGAVPVQAQNAGHRRQIVPLTWDLTRMPEAARHVPIVFEA